LKTNWIKFVEFVTQIKTLYLIGPFYSTTKD
jgi:hypothetical protein